MNTIILIALLCVGSAWCLPFSTRVVNGTDAAPGQYPYVCSLRSASGSHSCGASILNNKWILTAAHCVDGRSATSMTIQYGMTKITSTSKNTAEVEKIIMHENYAPYRNYANDVALLKLKGKLVLNGKTIAAMKLPEQGFEVPANDTAVLVGWGYDKTGGSIQKNLQRVDLKVYSDKECNERHNGRTTVDHLCGGVDEGGKGQCSGDSGGPLTYNNTQVGIVSWSEKPCTIKPYPGVYTKVSHYVKWIVDNMAE